MNINYTKIRKEHREILEKISDDNIYHYIISNINSGLSSIGFSNEFVSYFVDNFRSLNFEEFYKKFDKEITEVYDVGFFQKIVPDYFTKEVIPHIPASKTVLDIGCGTGILMNRLSESQKFDNLIGIDINRYAEWKEFKKNSIKFKVVREREFGNFLEKSKPDNIILTWTLHHMEYQEQIRYLKEIFSTLNDGSRLIVLEDTYTEQFAPKYGENLYESFMQLNPVERKIVMSVYDWIANRILARRQKIPIPCGYRSLEEWQNLCEDIGYKTIDNIFIGFPDKRDINTPQGLFIIEA